MPTRAQRLQLDVAGRWHEVMARVFFPLFPPQNTLPSLSRRSWGNNKPWVALFWVWFWILADSTPSAPSTASTTEWKYSRGAGSAAAAWS